MNVALRARTFVYPVGGSLAIALCAAAPLLAAEGSAPNPADTTTGFVFRWINFALVFGGLFWVVAKFGRPYFRSHAADVGGAIREAATKRAAAERDLREATEALEKLASEIQDLRRAAVHEAGVEAERIRDRARIEAGKIAQAARAEIEAAERAAQQELRAIAARLATERAAALLHAQMNAAVQSRLFSSFIDELKRSAA
jgi:F-type H+-transporting ATPase subunit b